MSFSCYLNLIRKYLNHLYKVVISLKTFTPRIHIIRVSWVVNLIMKEWIFLYMQWIVDHKCVYCVLSSSWTPYLQGIWQQQNNILLISFKNKSLECTIWQFVDKGDFLLCLFSYRICIYKMKMFVEVVAGELENKEWDANEINIRFCRILFCTHRK